MGYWDDFFARNDLKQYGSNALLLYALQLKFDIDDIDSIAADAITDGAQDKKCDLIYLDENNGIAVIAQGYIRQNPQADDIAKSNKASDLNTASGWIFERKEDDLPNDIKNQVLTLREAVKKENITRLYFWYVHNCKESTQVREELQTVELSAKTLIDKFMPDNNIGIYANEIGKETLERWYASTTNTILVNDNISIPLHGKGFELLGDKWKAYQTCISGKQLYSFYKTYLDDLFSANPRRFLGIDKRAKTKIINAGIKNSAENAPKNFWAYNNGITALTHFYDVEDDCLNCTGISIINGAQTTGSIGSLMECPSDDLLISIRVIECTDDTTIRAIIDNNNKQNEMLPSDFRSNDAIQKRLRNEFEKYANIVYNGGLRKNQSVRGKEVFDHFLVGQTLMAFHGSPVTAYDNKVEIWGNDKLYAEVFDDNLTAEHIILVYSLSKTIDQLKTDLTLKKRNCNISNIESEWLDYFGNRGSRILLLSTIAMNLEIILDKSLGNMRRLEYKDNSNFDNCKNAWKPIVNMVLSFCEKLKPVLSAGGLNSREIANSAIKEVGSIINYSNKANGGATKETTSFLDKLKY